MHDWYARVLDQEFGPMPFEDLVVLARQGTLRTSDQVRQADGEWMTAGEVAGLFVAEGNVPQGDHTHLPPHPQPLSRRPRLRRGAREREEGVFPAKQARKQPRPWHSTDERGWGLELGLLVACGLLLVLQLFPHFFVRFTGLFDVRSWSLVDFAVASAVFLGLLVAVRVVDSLVPP